MTTSAPTPETVFLDVARDYTPTPGGRYRKEGRWSGEEFRVDHLEPLLKAGKSVVVDLDGAVGFQTSFLDEVFGGIVRLFGRQVMERVHIQAVRRPRRVDLAMEFVERAIRETGGKR